MMGFLTRLMLPFLLLAQVGAGMSPGRVLCIAAECCAGNEVIHHDHEYDHEYDHAHHHAHGTHSHGDHRHAGGCANDAELAAPSECDCHIHVTLPDDAGASRDRSGERIADVRYFQPAVMPLVAIEVAPAARAAIVEPPEDARADTDQCRAREVTRLLI